MSDGDRSFRWEQLDQRLLRPKLEELSEEMQNRSIKATNKAASDTRESGNTAGYFPRLFEAQRQLTDEWAQKLYDVHCEVWRMQGHAITADFIRAISQTAIPALIVTRKGTVEHGAELRSKRTRHRGSHIPLRMWAKMIAKLRARWVSKLEAEAVASECRFTIGNTEPVGDTMVDPVDNSSKKRLAITKAPPPPTVLSGTYWGPREPKPTEVLDHLPPYYPTSLNAKTYLIICEAVKKFPAQTHVAELCKYVIVKLRPLFRKVILESTLRQDRALSEMSDLIKSLLVYNCDSDSRRYELEKELWRSDEWLRFAKTIAASRPTRVGPETIQEEKARAGEDQRAGTRAAPTRRLVDSRKELIAQLKARHPGKKARRICELIDQTISAVPSRETALVPLESWRRKASDERSWVGCYDNPKIRDLVRSYVNKVPPLKTSR